MKHLIFVLAAVVSTVVSVDIPGFDFIGATNTKQFYLSHESADFYRSLLACERSNLKLVALETAEEIRALNSFFTAAEANHTGDIISYTLYTSGIDRLGKIPQHWASTGQEAVFPVGLVVPWPPGGETSFYADWICVSVYRICNRLPGNQEPGCNPGKTDLAISTCTGNKKFICENRLD